MNKALSVMTELSRTAVSPQRRFIHEIAREFSQGKIHYIAQFYRDMTNSTIMKKDDVGKPLIK